MKNKESSPVNLPHVLALHKQTMDDQAITIRRMQREIRSLRRQVKLLCQAVGTRPLQSDVEEES